MSVAKIHRKPLLALAALAVSLAALPATASADFDFAPGSVFAKGHAPLTQAGVAIVAPPGYTQATFNPGSGIDTWGANLAAAPELTQAGGHPDFTAGFVFTSPGGGGTDATMTSRTSSPTPPPGAIGNPLAVPRCEAADFHLSIFGACPTESQVGVAVSYATVPLTVPQPGLQPGALPRPAAACSASRSLERHRSSAHRRVAQRRRLRAAGRRPTTSVTELHVVQRQHAHPLGRPARPRPRRLPFRRRSAASAPRIPLGTPSCPSSPRRPTAPPARSTSASRPLLGEPRTAGSRRPRPPPSRPAAIRSTSTRPSPRSRPPTSPISPRGLEVDVHTPQNNDACERSNLPADHRTCSTTAAWPPPTSRTPRSPCRRAW